VIQESVRERFPRVSLRARVALLAAFCVGGAVALVSIAAYVTVSRNLYSQVDDNLKARATSLVTDQTVQQTGGRNVPSFFFELSDLRFDIIDSSGQSLFEQPVLQRPPVGADEIKVAAGNDRSVANRPTSLRTDGKTDSRVLAVPYIGRGTALVISQPLKSTENSLSSLFVVLVVVGGAGILLAALLGTAVARGSLRPVLRLTRATERVTRTGDLRPIPVTGDDELARLSQSFNTMLGAVAEAQERQRRLVADAGHELRTPLTSLRTNLELLLAAEAPGTPTLSEKDRSEIHADLRAQLDELTQLIGDLVELAREDAAHTTWEPVEFSEVVEQALDRARRRAGDLEFDVLLQRWRLIGDPGALERAVLNLLDNAIKFSPPSGTIRVRLGPTGDGFAVLAVSDQGPGIADEDLPRVFDRFYRSSEARTLPGSGLGLAIVKQAALRHGGEVLAGHSTEGGALITMRLPGTPE
jgi:two-component system sensor histidine kinase MprB